MPDYHPDDSPRGELPSRPVAQPAASAKPGSALSMQGGVTAQRTGSTQDGTLLPAALYNLMIAEQYIDETKFPAEHKLISFHYGVALLAAYRNDFTKRGRASQYLSAAAGWQASEHDTEESKEAIQRIVCESHYNLGVIEELNRNHRHAATHYESAIAEADPKGRLDEREIHDRGILNNVIILAQLGRISCDVQLVDEYHTQESTPPAARMLEAAAMPSGIPAADMITEQENKTRLETARRNIAVLRAQIEHLRSLPKASPSDRTPRRVASAMRRPRGPLGFLRRATPPPESSASFEGAASALGSVVALRRQEILEAIENKLTEFERSLNKRVPPAAAEQP